MALNKPIHRTIISKNNGKIQTSMLYASTVLCRKCKESEKTLEKQLLVVYCIADFTVIKGNMNSDL